MKKIEKITKNCVYTYFTFFIFKRWVCKVESEWRDEGKELDAIYTLPCYCFRKTLLYFYHNFEIESRCFHSLLVTVFTFYSEQLYHDLKCFTFRLAHTHIAFALASFKSVDLRTLRAIFNDVFPHNKNQITPKKFKNIIIIESISWLLWGERKKKEISWMFCYFSHSFSCCVQMKRWF